MKNFFLLTLAVATLLLAPSAFAGDFVQKVEQAHGASAWNAQQVFAADLLVNFGGQTMVEGKMWTDTPVGKTRFELKDGSVLVFDGKDAWTSPVDSKFQGTRFHVLTWPYFLAAPMKLDDPGTQMKDLGKKLFREGELLPAARLTFGEGVGDSPDDWYVVYRDENDYVAGMAYIVTFGQDKEVAEKQPHAITYHDYQNVDGVMIPTSWKFWNWNERVGVHGEPVGHATLKNPQFVRVGADAFAKPQNARKEDAPAR